MKDSSWFQVILFSLPNLLRGIEVQPRHDGCGLEIASEADPKPTCDASDSGLVPSCMDLFFVASKEEIPSVSPLDPYRRTFRDCGQLDG